MLHKRFLYNEITVIDKDKEKLEMISTKFDVCTIEGDACCTTTLAGAKAENADMVFSALPFDYANLFICHTNSFVVVANFNNDSVVYGYQKVVNSRLADWATYDSKNPLSVYRTCRIYQLSNHKNISYCLACAVGVCIFTLDKNFDLTTGKFIFKIWEYKIFEFFTFFLFFYAYCLQYCVFG